MMYAMRTTIACLALCASVPACWTDRAQPTVPRAASTPAQGETAEAKPVETKPVETKPERDYRAVTVALDAAGVGAMVAGLALVHRNSNDTAGGALIDSGVAVAGFGSIITHVVMGHADRAWRRYLIQGGALLFTGIAGSMIACGDHSEGLDGLGCTIEGMVGGSAVGFVAASAIDALVLQAPSHSVVPIVSPTEGGARVGLGGTF
jgi:hypothetical protein